MAYQGGEAPVRLALSAGAVLVVLLGWLSGWLGFEAYQDHTTDRTREVLIATARQCAADLTSVDHTRVEVDVERILNCATGGFRAEFAGRSDSLIDVVKRSQSTSVGTVTEAGLESVSGDEGVALVAVTVRTAIGGISDGRPRQLRMRLTVAMQGEQAKVSRVDFIA
ncbi:MAG TPA: mammalian cell entry protein [Mycobacterium sp.]|nr:MAG: mammalian cell entry protein [Mycobacterium sp.]HOB48000.1 mammalian cell entry protein [Mycobacterium sp.]HPZ93428.1 mammalian cell entry protein [Mycobacterium sp.]HQE13850.1 mammalian cell entry protein [Mycobacterium sp.]